jgi:flagellar hook assembly protein FlgD
VNGNATLTVFNTLGQEVRTLVTGPLAAGRSRVVWNATDQSGRTVASGVYFYRLTVNGAGKEFFSSVKKMLLVR